MFCPEDGTHIPLTEEIHGQHPVYDCPQCHQTWVWDMDEEVYANYPNRARALVMYEAGEEDVTHLLIPEPAKDEECPGCEAGEEHTHTEAGIPLANQHTFPGDS